CARGETGTVDYW
nr:immunoglobulin heavy chain junction region [Mus musculus]